MSLPNLSQLSIDATLFEHVALYGGGKQKCHAHKEPILTEDDADPSRNCAVDGYLMYKNVPGAVRSPASYSGTYIDVVVDGQDVQLKPLLKRTRSSADRKSDFEYRHFQWTRDMLEIPHRSPLHRKVLRAAPTLNFWATKSRRWILVRPAAPVWSVRDSVSTRTLGRTPIPSSAELTFWPPAWRQQHESRRRAGRRCLFQTFVKS